jgi:hypothetical protein
MLKTVKLLLPALIPSWRFFDTVAPSPRIEWVLLKTAHETPNNWQEFRARPITLTVRTMLKRIFLNSRWNESLYLVSCAENLMENGAGHNEQEIVKRIKADIEQGAGDIMLMPYLQFRVVIVSTEGAQLQKHITFISALYHASRNAVL